MTGHADNRLRIDSYDWRGGREAVLRFGPDHGPAVIVALPLLEEGNRTRSLAVSVLRLLTDRGIGGLLPDLPGTGESMTSTEEMRLANMQDAFAAAAATRPGVHGVAIRSGALIDRAATLAGRWHLSPQDGASLLREWRRIAGQGADAPSLAVAGNAVAPGLLEDLREAEPAKHNARTLRLANGAGRADGTLPGSPVWRHSEPRNDPVLAQAISDDIVRWILM
ncbi:hypothetical protein SAMN05192583_0180 [Sphingomonas gellani]|uniref:Alpha/beta hydrolase n=1 Tax=Sphingomonas gellani TaxID=1166340 RepID=A0A1H7YAE7_9SPHN|nr:hypothetical protein [Sphingomonas gellani]SEM43100.1 hypothetical protein SAMN05192583_0180 [Sphingomonas gellani]